MNSKKSITGYALTVGLFFILLIYFSVFKKYQFLSQEQFQLFLYDFEFFSDKIVLPGGFIIYFGEFLTQFFIYPWGGPLIFSLAVTGIYLLTRIILRKNNIENFILDIFPAWLTVIQLKSEIYTVDQVSGTICFLAFFAIYQYINNPRLRYIFFFSGWPALYFLSGGYALPAIVLCIIYELLNNDKSGKQIALSFLLSGAIFLYLFSRFIFYVPDIPGYLYPVRFYKEPYLSAAQVLLLFWCPVWLIVSNLFAKRFDLSLRWNLKNITVSFVTFLLMGFIVYRYSYSRKSELMFGIDHYAQQENWTKVLELSGEYDEPNVLVSYYTNLALSQTDQMFQRMFSFPQSGTEGLILRWTNSFNMFYGGIVFYYMHYMNEAYRWSFESNTAIKQNPRSMKMLVKTSITNRDYLIAQKFLNQLDKTLFYKHWGDRYKRMLSDTTLIGKDVEIMRNRSFAIRSDFIADFSGMNFYNLFLNHPENKMVYDYMMASLLLQKNLDEFVRFVFGLGNLHYKQLPVYFEEALILYASWNEANAMPEGFTFSPEIIRRYNDYVKTYLAYKNKRETAAAELKRKFKNTYWYYFQFS